MEVTKEQFDAYEDVRLSGETNMFDIRKVIELSGDILTREICLEVMKQYSELRSKFGYEDEDY